MSFTSFIYNGPFNVLAMTYTAITCDRQLSYVAFDIPSLQHPSFLIPIICGVLQLEL